MRKAKRKKHSDAFERFMQSPHAKAHFLSSHEASPEHTGISMRGRPAAWRSADKERFQSKEAATFLVEQMRLFREINDIQRIQPDDRKELWKIAKVFYPKADEVIAEEYISRNRKWFDDEIRDEDDDEICDEDTDAN